MANFTTHIAVGTVVSGALATLTLAADVIPREALVAITMAGVLGSVLPDIDLKDSRPSRAMFAGLGIFFSFAVLFSVAGKYSIVELWVLWLGTLAGVRYGVHAVFHRFAVHRGIWHSLLAMVFFGLATSVVFKYILGEADHIAWLAAGFMAIGYLTHLILDEVYSVDVMDTRLKASFGTALKLIDLHHLQSSALMAAAVAGLMMIAPPAKPFVEGLTSHSLWANLEAKLLPQESWFGIVDTKRAVASTPVAAPAEPGAPSSTATGTPLPAPLTTGSLPSPAARAVPGPSPFKTIASEAPDAPAK